MATHRRGYASNIHKKPEILMIKLAAVIVFFYALIKLLLEYSGIFAALLIALAMIIFFNIWMRVQRAKKRKDILLTLGASNPMQLSPQQYERFCGLLLEQNGWIVSYTPVKGDQGGDIIAEKNGERTVLQCKQWSSSVGVKAVQEVHAARSFYRARSAIVVSTAAYTSGAKELARSTGVDLLNHNDLQAM